MTTDGGASGSAETAAGQPVAVLVDSSAWVDHFRRPDPLIDALLSRTMARGHPDVVGELAMGRDPEAADCKEAVQGLPSVEPIDRDVVLRLVSAYGINSQGIGWVDAGLIAACVHSDDPLALYTRDRAMARVARELGIVVVGSGH